MANKLRSKWHALAVYFYGAAAIAYDRIGLNERTGVYDVIANFDHGWR